MKLYNRPNIPSLIKSKRLEWFGYLWRVNRQLLKKVSINKINKKMTIRKTQDPLSGCCYSINIKYKRKHDF